mmetsp:Transcript_78559/g.177429  ORF Transcript_78559/g.177429 Transcript_78559/m.177429 type:complete len:177 (+) Transcript_78559:89-619(+)|eukprot:CAMPEP_0197883466 /NCGR_PEP_ID=MMETSP1439-20131203/10286_1 /TAXON_ID=66791 /ORGANISM="Gonyaulax spinifera, Strain CCMP409" /LENGTH=176 /DNA_ID=CAMNT_0043503187 /DNA_START=81 /DNA_END=611 /DNA_ORIENTATION=+
MALVRSIRRSAQKVPDVFVQFGLEQQFRFISHPGVMAVSKLLEMRTICGMRASFTQENIEKMKAFDPELARKAQIAYEHKLPVNFQQLELIDDVLPRLLEEKQQLTAARDGVAKIPAGGPYQLPDIKLDAVRPAPGQKDVQGTLFELAEVLYPGKTGNLIAGPLSSGSAQISAGKK